MEYSESSFNGGLTYQHQCGQCGNEKHQVKGAIRYAYFFIESLPFFPVGRSVSLECTECLYIADKDQISDSLYRELISSIFTVYHFGIKCLGIFLVAFFCYHWWQSEAESQKEVAKIVRYAQVNDFYLLDFRQLSNELRPHEKYRLAKIIDVTGDTFSLVYSNFFYQRPSAFREVIQAGHVTNFSYFGKKRYDFTQKQLDQMLAEKTIVNAARPYGNMLFGRFVISDTGYKVGAIYRPGEREYASALAFEEATYLNNNFQTAFEYLLKAAEMGFGLAQIKLAEYYLTGKTLEINFDSALFWLEQASKQSYKSAINKYVIVCKQSKGCDVELFYQRLLNAGVNLQVNN